MNKQKLKDAAWADAKKKCRLNVQDIQMAKELGMTPKSLIKNIPSPSQKWKAPVSVWIRDLHEDKFGKKMQYNQANTKKTKPDASEDDIDLFIDDDNLPF